MSNDKHPDHHFDDDLIAQLYDASKETMQPSTDLDDLILSTLNGSAGDNVVDVDGSIDSGIDNKIVNLSLTKDEANRTSKNASKKKSWFVPNSLVACLVVSVMVGLLYRENADKLLISDPTELDYAIPQAMPIPSAERRVSAKAEATVFGESQSVEPDSSPLMDLDSSLSELQDEDIGEVIGEVQGEVQSGAVNDFEAPVVVKQEVAEKELSTLQVDSVSGPSVASESKMVASPKMKKSKSKPLMRQDTPARMRMMAPVDNIQEEVQDTTTFDARFNQIRELRDAGNVEGAIKLLDSLLTEYPSIDVPEDIMILKQGF